MLQAYGDSLMNMPVVYHWYNMFQDGWENVVDELREGRPRTARNEVLWNTVAVVIWGVAQCLNISVGSAFPILHDNCHVWNIIMYRKRKVHSHYSRMQQKYQLNKKLFQKFFRIKFRTKNTVDAYVCPIPPPPHSGTRDDPFSNRWSSQKLIYLIYGNIFYTFFKS